jgi:uncharacterized membrane protein
MRTKGLLVLNLTVAGTIHAALAAVGVLIGIVQFLRRKGDPLHHAIGYAYVYALLVADCTALLIFQFTGRLNILHFGAVTSLICLALGIWPLLRSPRRPTWRTKHYMWISWSYVGLLAAAGTELVVRTAPFTHAWQVWTATALTTMAVTLCGGAIIFRYRPLPLR